MTEITSSKPSLTLAQCQEIDEAAFRIAKAIVGAEGDFSPAAVAAYEACSAEEVKDWVETFCADVAQTCDDVDLLAESVQHHVEKLSE